MLVGGQVSEGKCWKMTAAGSCADPALLREVMRPLPPVGPSEVLVAVRAAALNPIDTKMLAGKVAIMAKPPLVAGFDFAGVVHAAGDASGFAPGEEVFGDVPNRKEASPVGGSLSEYILVPAGLVARKPESLTAPEAASLPLVAVTVLDALVRAAPSPEARVLILGASGGVGTAAVQICKARGLHVVGVCSGRNRDLVLGLGADEVIDYTATDWSAALAEQKVEVVFDFAPSSAASAESWGKAKRVLAPGGRFISISGEDPEGRVSLGKVIGAAVKQTWRNLFSGFKYYFVMKAAGAEKLAEVARLVDAKQLRPIVEQVYPWGEVHTAYAKLMSGRASGKLVVSVP